MNTFGKFLGKYWGYGLLGLAVLLIGGMTYVVSAEYGWFAHPELPTTGGQVVGEEMAETEDAAEPDEAITTVPTHQPQPSYPSSSDTVLTSNPNPVLPVPDDELPWQTGPSDSTPIPSGSGSSLPWYDGPSD